MLFIVGIAIAKTKRHLTTFASTRALQDAFLRSEIERQSINYTRWT